MREKRLVLKPKTNLSGVIFIVLFAIAFIFGIALLVFGKERGYYVNKNGVILYSVKNVHELKERLSLYKYINQYPLQVEPYLLKSFPKDFSHLRAKERKKLFIKALLPIAILVNKQFRNEHQMFEKIAEKIKKGEVLSRVDREILNYGLKKYKCHTLKELLIKSGGVPVSLLIAQAGIESGWGKSRFAIQYNNIYGIHRKHPKPGKIVMRFKSLYSATVEYVLNLDRSRAYRRFRLARYRMGDFPNPYKLAEFLTLYSTKRNHYIHLIQRIITANNLVAYDKKFESIVVAENASPNNSLE